MGRGKLRLLVSDVPKAKQALTAAQYRLGQETVLTLTLEDRPGILAGIAEKLAAAKINIKFAYATAAGGGSCTVALGVSNPDKGAGGPRRIAPEIPASL